MAYLWRKPPFRSLFYLEWVLLGIAFLSALSVLIPHPRHYLFVPPWFRLAGILCIAALGLMGLWLPINSSSKLLPRIYIIGGLLLSWLAIAFLGRGERIFPTLLLIVVIRACLLFSWTGRIATAVVACCSFFAVQVMALMRISFLGVPLARSLPPGLRRLPPEVLRRVWFGLVFNSALLFALVLAFVLLLVGALLAEYQSKAKLAQANRRLREYALQIEDRAALQERNRIAREIHDSVGHYLTAQSIQLENTFLFLEKNPVKAATHLEQARQLNKEALINIRSSVASLRKNTFPERSLTALLKQLVDDFELNTNIKVIRQLDLTSSLPERVSIALYRIVQEALTNVAKHAQASKIILHLTQSDEQVLLSIQDNGCGFDLHNNSTGFGLQGIQERAAALQGKLSIVSEPNKGCQINLSVPLSSSPI